MGSVLNGNPEVICECTRAVHALNLQSGFPALESSFDQQPSRSRVQVFQSSYFKQLTGLSFAFWVFSSSYDDRISNYLCKMPAKRVGVTRRISSLNEAL